MRRLAELLPGEQDPAPAPRAQQPRLSQTSLHPDRRGSCTEPRPDGPLRRASTWLFRRNIYVHHFHFHLQPCHKFQVRGRRRFSAAGAACGASACYRHARTHFVQQVTGFKLSSGAGSPQRLCHLTLLGDERQCVCRVFDLLLATQQAEHDANAFDTTCGHDAHQARQRAGVDLYGIPY